jgi:predicted DNA-binding transcriptional regulator AlpA
MSYVPSEPLLTSSQAAAEVNLSLPGFWQAVAAGRLPAPFYPAARAPRWQRSEILIALEATRSLPRDQKVARMKQTLAKRQIIA